jgi:alpha-ribazole phosphatase
VSKVKMTTLDLLRHGHCEGGEIFRGSTDVPLTDSGWQQMRNAVEPLDGWDLVISSPLQRCRLFAERFIEDEELPLEIENDLRELHFGDWEGQRLDYVAEKFGKHLSTFWRDPVEGAPPNSEPFLDFQARLNNKVEQLVNRYEGEHLLLVSHGAAIRIIMCELLGMSYKDITKISVPFASISRFRIVLRKNKKPWVQMCFHRGDEVGSEK